MNARNTLRGSVFVAALCLPSVLASSASADVNPDFTSRADHLSPGIAVLVFLGIPVGAFLVIAGLVLLLTAPRRRYRPGAAWTASPIWFNGPVSEPEAAIANAKPAMVGGATGAEW